MTSKLVIGVLLAVTLGAQTARYVKTAGYFNGRYWQSISTLEKGAFMSGYWAAEDDIYNSQDGKCPYCFTTPRGYTNYEIAEMLDTFYRTPENGPIPIHWALDRLWEKLDNKKLSPKELDQTLQAVRQWAASVPQESE